MEQRILPKNIFLAHFKIIFIIFVSSAPVEFLSKIQISKKCLKLWRTLLFMNGTNNFVQKYLLSTF